MFATWIRKDEGDTLFILTYPSEDEIYCEATTSLINDENG